jgi:transcriptional regulator
MHPDGRFHWADRDDILAFLADRAFATIFVSAAAGGFVVHAPLIVHSADRLRFHVSRRNRAVAVLDGARASLSCIGTDAYISPDWYGSADQVPTWNYVAVEAEGALRQLDDEELVAQLDALSAAHEARLLPKTPWTRHKMTPGRFEAMTKAIVGDELAIEELRGTRKLGQNKRAEDRAGALGGLAASGREDMAALMRAEFAKE